MNRLVAVFALLACLGMAQSASAIICIDQAAFDAGNTVWGDNLDEFGAPNDESEVVVRDTLRVRGGRTLEILPGVVVRGLPRLDGAAAAASFPGSIVVTQSGMIDAQGTPNSPIIMTTAALDTNADNIPDRSALDPAFFERWDCTGPRPTFYDDDPQNVIRPPLAADGINNVQMWGGLVILGSAPTNLDGSCFATVGANFGECNIEGLEPAFFPLEDIVYGGEVPNDNSGTIRYLQIKHGGDEIGVANEINGLTMGGVGSGTTLEFIEVSYNYDDGFEWFGGTVNGRGLVSTLNGDDQFDTDQGYTGTNQLLYATLPFADATTVDPRQGDTLFGSASGDKGWEADGDDMESGLPNGDLSLVGYGGATLARSNDFPYGNPGDYANYPGRAHFATFCNATVLSHAGATNFAPTASANGRLQMRNGFGGHFINIIMGNQGTSGATGPIECTSTRWDGYNCGDNVKKTKVFARSTPVRIVSSTFYGYTNPIVGDELLALTRGDEMGGGANITAGFGGMVNDDYTFAPDGGADNIVTIADFPAGAIVPIPAASFGYDDGSRAGSCDQDFRGAFAQGVDEWTDGWTIMSIAGVH